MSRTLKSLAQHKKDVVNELLFKYKDGALTGVECPNCKSELIISSANITLIQYPSLWVKCYKCEETCFYFL